MNEADSTKSDLKKYSSILLLLGLIFCGVALIAGISFYIFLHGNSPVDKFFMVSKWMAPFSETEAQKRLKAEDGFWNQYQGIDGNGQSDSCDRFPEISGGTIKAALPKLKDFAEKGDKIAQCQLGLIYMQGLGGVEKNKKAGMGYWLKAAEAGDAQAQFSLGMIYDYGNSETRRDPKKAFYWYGKSAAQGHFKGGFNFACMEQNSPSSKIREKGIVALKQFFDQGEPWAGFRLGEYYAGKGMDLDRPTAKERKGEDWQQAIFYFQKASEAGNTGSMYDLGVMYQLGHGVPVDLAKRNELWEKAAKKKEKFAQRSLGECYFTGDGIPQNIPKGVALLKAAAKQGDAESAAVLGKLYHDGMGVTQDDSEAVKYWQMALDNGREQVRKFLIRAYQEGNGVSKDDEQANQLVTEGLEKGSAEIEYTYGMNLLEAADTPEEEADAAQWIKKSARQNDVLAEQKLADLYKRGQGVPKNLETSAAWQKKADKQLKEKAKEGVVWALKDLAAENLDNHPQQALRDYRKAAKEGDAEAQYLLGVLYFKGQGIRANPHMAAAWWKKAAEQQNISAAKSLGALYLSGIVSPDIILEDRKTEVKTDTQTESEKETKQSRIGVKRNLKIAAKYYKQAADLGDAEAQNVIGQLYSTGQGVRKDWKEAVHYWLKAAEQDNAVAQSSLSMAYKIGKGVKADQEQSDYWAQKAASGGEVSA